MNQITDVACTVCGCVCDDLTITVENNRITRAEKACVLAEPWFLSQNAVRPPIAQIDGKAASLEDALDRAAEILRQSRSPLIYGLSRSTTEGQRAAVALAERLGATIDTTATTGHAPSLMALQQVGESTCTLGEVKNRADLVVYWATDPLVSHPRHLERYAVDATGMFVPRGRADRFVVVAANAENETTKRADLFLRIEPGKDWEALWTLRGLLKGIEPASPAGASLDQLRLLAERMKTCRCGIVFFGAGLTRSSLGHRNVEALLQLVTELNAFTRFYARRMRRLGDVAGADSVLTWQTGYPFAVNFALGYPRYNPGEFSAPEMLARGEIDACLFVGSETSAEFPKAAAESLRRIPIVALESPGTQLAFPTAVHFTTAVYGVHRPGTAYRMDEVPIPLRVLLETDYPSDGEILNGLLHRLSLIKSAN
jgi:formylmethanofuran dehydrogenase subunit B